MVTPSEFKGKTVYYAHPVSSYGTVEESMDITFLTSFGFNLVNPNEPQHNISYQEQGMNYFLALVRTCDCCVFKTFPDGRIGAGVAAEIASFLDRDYPVFQLVRDIGESKHKLIPVLTMPDAELILSIPETREWIERYRVVARVK